MPTEAELIAFAKKIDVAKLDPALASQSLEDWLQLGPARVDRLTWGAGIGSCDDKPEGEEPPDGFELCAQIAFRKNGVVGYIRLTLGTTRNGIVEPPKFKYALVYFRPGSGFGLEGISKLSDLPRTIEEPPKPK